MKKNYIIPNTITESFRTEYLCGTSVASVQGGTLGWGGEQGDIDPN